MIQRDFVYKLETTWLSPTPKGHDCWNNIRFNCDLVHLKDSRKIAFEGSRHRAAGIPFAWSDMIHMRSFVSVQHS